ncbi:MAG: hypothetical protein IPM54_44325 [Polyangiaceae bacterium]|nr:hypothetical protein [Polyangiaceae bacterium]
MTLRKCAITLVIGVALGTTGCRDDQAPDEAQDLWTRIHDAKYQSWDRAPGYAARMPTSAPHSDAVEIFVNDVVQGALGGSAITAWPDGSIIAKDGYDSDGDLDIVAAMEKRGSEWFWVEWSADGESLYSGKPSICTDCHAPGADFVLAFGFPK